ncbi:acyl-CoA dehydrogenase family protein [Pseudonocardia broussonetiae]|uniref:Acyl-CoA/acyl-ACP dehydrogenase n=1 Tax=Pseudonocardia broussonetiae TaxID=2736640 RepID=A0A6M6JI53_9PSEU|nr:acyl-CoA dehydrogenase family protein [Pseudonocardia broussonetiae]QJY46071.1 acyl-CoA/acyl-ACP dehydrogenase [Pseudonocardia broussonetiae]
MSKELHEDIRAAVGGMCADPAAEFDEALWAGLADNGFTLLGVPEQAGGSGGDLDDLAVAVETAARCAAPVPLADTAFVAGWLLAGAGLAIPDLGPMAVSAQALPADADGTVSGQVEAAWARHAGHVVVPVLKAGELLVAAFPRADLALTQGANLAGEPRDVLTLDRCPLPLLTAPAAAGVDPTAVLRRGALARSVQLAGAADSVLALSLRYAGERVQFGRPLNRFQAVQQSLATLAAHATMMRTSAMAAVLAVQECAPGADLAIAAAKATTSASAAVVATVGHQVHGALGFSREHRLGASTTRLWSWRDEFGDESFWQDVLADLVLAADAWWPALTR